MPFLWEQTTTWESEELDTAPLTCTCESTHKCPKFLIFILAVDYFLSLLKIVNVFYCISCYKFPTPISQTIYTQSDIPIYRVLYFLAYLNLIGNCKLKSTYLILSNLMTDDKRSRFKFCLYYSKILFFFFWRQIKLIKM